jgi:lipopolysaccharide assembly outer membrane protein LptD (OstA)
MKYLLIGCSALCGLAIVSIAALPKNGIDTKAMHMVMSLPDGKGKFALVAEHIDREWATNIDHLSGNVRVEIHTAAKNERTAMIVRADQVDYNANTGEFSAAGNVRFTLEEPRKR